MNTQGIFEIELLDGNREVKCNFAVIERLERHVFKRPIMQVLTECIQGQVYFGEVVDTIIEGLKANDDTRFKRDEIGEYVHSKGMDNYVQWYIEYLTYALTGDKAPDVEAVDDKKK